MMKPTMIALGTLLFTSVTAFAAEDCSRLTDSTARLNCYDQASKTSVPPPNEQSATADHLPGNFELTDPQDLWVSPSKYEGKLIELRNVQCFFADKNEYRCLAPNDGDPVMVVSADVLSLKEKTKLQDQCGVVRAVATPKCTRTIHFIPIHSEQDDVNAMTKRAVFAALLMEVYTPAR